MKKKYNKPKSDVHKVDIAILMDGVWITGKGTLMGFHLKDGTAILETTLIKKLP